jgi:hypothetical protein
VLELDSGRDYRLARMAGQPVYHYPVGKKAHDALESAFAKLTDGATGESTKLFVKGRSLIVPGPRAPSPGSALPSSAQNLWPPPTTWRSPKNSLPSSSKAFPTLAPNSATRPGASTS